MGKGTHMSSPYTRRRFLSSSGIGLVTILTGCLTNSNYDAPANRTTSSTAQETSDGQTVASAVLSDAEAKERALHTEENYLERQFSSASCLDEWGTTATTVRKSATVTDRTAEGVRVEVIHPFWFMETWTEAGSNRAYQSHADGGSHAQYLVTPETIKRLSGDSLSPC